MPRVSEAVDDTTPLGGARIDVPARIGWLLRCHRTVGGLSLRQMSTSLREHDIRLSSTTLGRIESEGQRSSAALDGYAAVLGLPEGVLRASVDSMCRAFGYAPGAPSDSAARSLEGYGAAVDAVSDGAPVGGAWLRFARFHAAPNGFGLPTGLMDPLVRRLVHELLRSTTTAHITRYGALLELLGSPYRPLVETFVRAQVLAPGTPRIDWLTSVLSDAPTAPTLAWCAGLLDHEADHVVQAGSWALQSMLVAGGLSAADWATVVPAFHRAWHDGAADPDVRRTALTQLWQAFPPPLRLATGRTCNVAVDPVPTPHSWVRGRDNAHYEWASAVSRTACRRMSQSEEPLLERLVFEAAFDPRGVRKVIARFQLLASPFGDTIVEVMLESADRAPDAEARRSILQAAAFLHRGQPVRTVDRLLASADGHDFIAGLTLAGQAGLRLPGSAVTRGLSADGATVRKTLGALGQAEDPRLADLATGEADAEVRAGARWWREHGGRVVV
ncbi:hypothetical protein H5V45_06200 [Nocardioides sp. KIGAM211]|uniref:Uncharacterized protein n=1 Tax=Nocardioides luti TaxID=2761101 RepID=A0A7X0V9P6_9ACTN|nr:hypothetical protein [Nocardioides luti]MBB6626909.1 hypothetical protein [Nocardioides luti]